jgi:hypothetical protein
MITRRERNGKHLYFVATIHRSIKNGKALGKHKTQLQRCCLSTEDRKEGRRTSWSRRFRMFAYFLFRARLNDIFVQCGLSNKRQASARRQEYIGLKRMKVCIKTAHGTRRQGLLINKRLGRKQL